MIRLVIRYLVFSQALDPPLTGALCERSRLGWDKTDLELGQYHLRAWSPAAKLQRKHWAPSVRTLCMTPHQEHP